MRRESRPDACLRGCERNTLTIAGIIETNCLAHSNDAIVSLPCVNMTFLQLGLNGRSHITLCIVRPTSISKLSCPKTQAVPKYSKINKNIPVLSELLLERAKVVMEYVTMILLAALELGMVQCLGIL